MIRLRYYILFVLSLIASASFSQNLGHYFLDGWTAARVFEGSNDSLITVGLSSPEGNGKHKIQLNKIDTDYHSGRGVNYQYPSSYITSLHTAATLRNQELIISGAYKLQSGGNDYGLILRYDSQLHLDTSNVFNFGKTNHSYDVISKDSGLVVLGLYQEEQTNNKVNSFLLFLNNHLDSIGSSRLSCSGFGSMGGCDLIPRNLIEVKNDGYLIACQKQPNLIQAYGPIFDPVVIKVDSTGAERWRLELGNDTFSRENIRIAESGNGNFLAVYTDRWYKPNMKPGEPNPNPQGTQKGTLQFTEFNKHGQVLKSWNFKESLKLYFDERRPYQQNHIINDIISTSDGGIMVAGITFENVTGTELGFLLKMDNNNDFQWYRQYKIDIGAPPPIFQETKILGVGELESGYFALTGEYKSPASDTFPQGTQKAFVILTDSFGCILPDCQKKVSVKPIYQNSIKIVPNPSVGNFSLVGDSFDKITNVVIYNTSGKIIPHTISRSTLSTSLSTSAVPGLYLMKVQTSEGYHHTLRLVITDQ